MTVRQDGDGNIVGIFTFKFGIWGILSTNFDCTCVTSKTDINTEYASPNTVLALNMAPPTELKSLIQYVALETGLNEDLGK